VSCSQIFCLEALAMRKGKLSCTRYAFIETVLGMIRFYLESIRITGFMQRKFLAGWLAPGALSSGMRYKAPYVFELPMGPSTRGGAYD